MYYTYILKLIDGSLYTGSTGDLQEIYRRSTGDLQEI